MATVTSRKAVKYIYHLINLKTYYWLILQVLGKADHALLIHIDYIELQGDLIVSDLLFIYCSLVIVESFCEYFYMVFRLWIQIQIDINWC